MKLIDSCQLSSFSTASSDFQKCKNQPPLLMAVLDSPALPHKVYCTVKEKHPVNQLDSKWLILTQRILRRHHALPTQARTVSHIVTGSDSPL